MSLLRIIKKMNKLMAVMILLLTLSGCRDVPVPRPRGYFRIDFPAKEYISSESNPIGHKIPFLTEYPLYGKLTPGDGSTGKQGWYNIELPDFKAKIYLTYKEVKNDLPSLIEQTYTMNVKNHISKADAINEEIISNSSSNVYGILYDLKGNTASAVQFYVTDSLKHYLRGSLYFNVEPNADSLATVVEFLRKDIVHMIETLKWKAD